MKVRAQLFSGITILCISAAILSAPGTVFTQDISGAADWLKANQNEDGSWGQGYESLVLDYESSRDPDYSTLEVSADLNFKM